MKQRGNRYCPICSTKLQRRGLTASGVQRWYCKTCSSSHTKPRHDVLRSNQLTGFISHLLSTESQTTMSKTRQYADRTWRTNTAWCWNIVPKPKRTGEACPVLLIDGTIVGGIVCLISRTPSCVIDWRWATYEASATWDTLLCTIPEPLVVVCDGQKGMILSIGRYWPHTRIQRCLFHVWLNMKAKLTLHPQTEAGQELLKHYRTIWQVETPEAAQDWAIHFEALYTEHGEFLRQRTVNQYSKPGQRKWWYTHRDVRSAYRQLDKLLADEQLFVYTETALKVQTTQPIPRTTNYVEGGTNAPLKELLRSHRGMPLTHQQRLTEWYLYDKTEHKKPPRNFL
jgi:hypothetical protein